MTEDDYSKLSRIAPTVAQTDEFVDFGMPWQQQTLLTGRALGREDRARELVAEVEDGFARARKEHPEFGQVTAVSAYYEENGNFGAYASTDPHVRFLSSLGFRTSAEIDKLAGDQVYTEISNERLRLLDRDVLVMLKAPETPPRVPSCSRTRSTAASTWCASDATSTPTPRPSPRLRSAAR